jgi:hypothetical protein
MSGNDRLNDPLAGSASPVAIKKVRINIQRGFPIERPDLPPMGCPSHAE